MYVMELKSQAGNSIVDGGAYSSAYLCCCKGSAQLAAAAV